MSNESRSLFESLGGAKGVRGAVDDMYDRVLADEELAPFFENISMDRLRRMQTTFVASMIDGPVRYTGAELSQVHRHLKITRHHFSRFCGHMADALEARNVDPELIDQVLARLATYSDKVTGSSNVDG